MLFYLYLTMHFKLFLFFSIILYFIVLFVFMIFFMLWLLDDKSTVFSENFECGFYPNLIQMLKYKFNYWMITIHFLIVELELCILLLLCFKFKSLNENCILAFLFGLLFCDLFLCIRNLKSSLYIMLLFFYYALILLFL